MANMTPQHEQIGADARVVQAVDALNRLLSHKTDSLFTYVLAASPYVEDGDREIVHLLESIVRDHQDQARELGRVILELEETPNPLSHDIGALDINYLSIRRLLDPLAKYQQHCIDEARQALGRLADFPAASKTVATIVETDQRDLEKIRSYLR